MNANTFSIAGRDARSGLLGIAIATRVPAVGAICPFVRHGVGAVLTQAWTNPYLGPAVLDRLAAGDDPATALGHAVAADPGRDFRQLGVVDAQGRSAAHTGAETDPWQGHRTGSDYSLQGNMLVGEAVLADMEAAFAAARDCPIEERLLRALEAGDAAGGDRRGKQSAALRVAGPEIYPLVDLRVDEHADPVAELRRIFEIAKRTLFPAVAAMPTRANPMGDMARLRSMQAPRK